MKSINKFIIVVFLAMSLVTWASAADARWGHRNSGYDRHSGLDHRSHGFYVFYGGYHHRPGYHLPPRYYLGHRHYRHWGYYYGHGHRTHLSIVLHFHNALEYARTDETTTWQNPDTGGSESITPYHTYQTNDGRYCREFIKTVTIGGEQHQAYGTACRQPDGSWEIVGP